MPTAAQRNRGMVIDAPPNSLAQLLGAPGAGVALELLGFLGLLLLDAMGRSATTVV
jgi:hypothetical protein